MSIARIAPENDYQPIQDILEEISMSQDAGALMAALSMIFVGISTMAWLALPVEKISCKRDDFCDWVDRYMKAEPFQPYQYKGIDVYAARCAMLHSYGSVADLHRLNMPPKVYGYLDNGPHRADEGQVVLISIAVFVRDFSAAVHEFLKSAANDPEVKVRIDSRIDALVRGFRVASIF